MGKFGIDLASDNWQGAIQQTTAALGRPQIIGQYLPIYPTDKARCTAILAAGLSIIPIWNGDGYGNCIASSTTALIEAQANQAVAAWAALGLPKGSAIFLDVETGFYLNATNAAKWITILHAAGFVPGFYLNAYSGNNHAAGYQAARALTKGIPCVYWTCQRELYAYASKMLTNLVVDANDAVAVPGYENECILWQYSENQLNGLVDYDVASTLDYFWQPSVTWHAKSTQALKPPPGNAPPVPNHSTASLHTVFGGDVVKLLGPSLTLKSEITGKPEIWVEVSTVGKDGKTYTGWLIKTNLYSD